MSKFYYEVLFKLKTSSPNTLLELSLTFSIHHIPIFMGVITSLKESLRLVVALLTIRVYFTQESRDALQDCLRFYDLEPPFINGYLK